MAKKYPLSSGSGMRAGFPRTSLSSMDDISVDNPQPGEGLVWNGTNWENAAIHGGGGSNLVYFPVNIASDLPAYMLLDTKPNPVGPGYSTTNVDASTSPVLIEEHITAALNRTLLQSGLWNITLYGSADPIAGNTKFRVIVTVADSTGAWKADIATVDSEPIDALTFHPVEMSFAAGEHTILVTDRLKIAIYAVTDSVTVVHVNMMFSDYVSPARIETPFIINHSDIPGLDYTVDGHTGHITMLSNQIAAITAKGSPVAGDVLLIEDSEDSYTKKSMTIADLPAIAPAVHDFAGALHQTSSIAAIQTKVSDGSFITTAAGEIDALAAKTVPADADELVIEDSADSFTKKKVTLSDMFAVSPSLSWKNPVISVYDNTSGLPAASVGDRYIALVTANGWTKDHIYECIA